MVGLLWNIFGGWRLFVRALLKIDNKHEKTANVEVRLEYAKNVEVSRMTEKEESALGCPALSEFHARPDGTLQAGRSG